MRHSITTRAPRRTSRRALARLSVAVVAAFGGFVAVSSPALADTSTASGQAAEVTILATGTLGSGTATAANSGVAPDTQAGSSPALTVLGAQSLLTAGVLVQRARANSTGTSAACAGVVGAGGTVSVGSDGSCTVATGTTGGVLIVLAPAVTGAFGVVLVPAVTLRADAVTARCTADSSGATTSAVSLVNAGVFSGNVQLLGLGANPTPNTGVTVPGVATIALHSTSVPSGAGSIGAAALRVNLLSGAAAVTLGTVTCGANALTVPIPSVPVAGIPVAAATVGVIGFGYLYRVRHRLVSVGRSASGRPRAGATV